MKNLLTIVALILTTNSFASETSHILSASTNSAFSFTPRAKESGYDTTFNITADYTYSLGNSVELGAQSSLIIGDLNSFTLLVGPGINFGAKKVNNSYFVNLRVGVNTYGDTGFTEHSNALAAMSFGKRMQLTENISYVPGVHVNYVFSSGNDYDPSFRLDIFRFSLFF